MSDPNESAPADSRWSRATESLRNTQFRRLFVGNLAFFLAMGGQGLVRPWIALELTDDPFALGLTGAAMAAPMFFLSPLGGALADRLDRRTLIATALSLALLTEAVVYVLLVTDRIEFWHLVVASAALGACFPLQMPARAAIVANLVDRKALGAAMGVNMTGMNLTQMLGPAMAGTLATWVGIEGAYGFNLCLYVVAIAATFSVRSAPPATRPTASLYENVLEGFRYLRSDRMVAILLLFGLVPQFLAMPFQQVLPVFARDVWVVGPWGLGMLSFAVGVGAMVGSMYIATRDQRKPRLPMMMVSVIVFCLLIAAFALSPSIWPAVVLAFLGNIGASVFRTLNNVSIQLVIPDEVRGRVSSFLMMSVSLPLLGGLPVTRVASAYGAPTAVAGACVLALVLALLFWVGSPSLRAVDERVRTKLREP
ncbi:MAG: MFS transporter [bacterium]|nr:MFS transporter [bacterium]